MTNHEYDESTIIAYRVCPGMAAMCEPDAATKNPDAQSTFANSMMQQAAMLHLLTRGPKQKSTFIFFSLDVAHHS